MRYGRAVMAKDHLDDEKRRREAALAAALDVEPGGREIEGRPLKQMVSVRLEAQLLKDLRTLAAERDVSISDLLRQAAVDLVDRARPAPVHVTFRSVGLPMVVFGWVTAGRSATSGVGQLTNTDQPAVSSGIGDLVIAT
jgi:Ribbon-helix-helix protein, copG family